MFAHTAPHQFTCFLHGTGGDIHFSDVHEPTEGTEIGYVTIRDSMHLEMDIRIKAFPESGMGNILQCGSITQNRYPGIWIHSEEGIGFDVRFSDQDNWNNGPYTGAVTTNQWYHLEMNITQSTFRVTVDNEIKYDASKSRHDTYQDMMCYLGNPWDPAADVEVRNMLYEEGLCVSKPSVH